MKRWFYRVMTDDSNSNAFQIAVGVFIAFCGFSVVATGHTMGYLMVAAGIFNVVVGLVIVAIRRGRHGKSYGQSTPSDVDHRPSVESHGDEGF